MRFFVSEFPGAFSMFARYAAACGGGGCGSGAWHGAGHGASAGGGEGVGAGSAGSAYRRGARGTLRFMAQRLDLNDGQVAELAQIIDELNIERAQVAVDERRSAAGIADALSGDSFDEGKVAAATALRVKSQERLREAVVKALRRSHQSLRPEQRQQLSYLLRTGALTI